MRLLQGQPLKFTLKFVFLCFLLVLPQTVNTILVKNYRKPNLALAKTEKNLVNIYFFYGDGCPHCAKEEKFFETLIKEYPNIQIHFFEVWGNRKNSSLLKEATTLLNAKLSGVPVTIIGENYIVGFQNSATTGETIKDYINYCSINECEDIGKALNVTRGDKILKGQNKSQSPWYENNNGVPKDIQAPLIGKIDLTKLSLPAIAVVLGTLDGFNPCAMWVLLFLISLLIGMPNKSKRWILGLTFLFASGFVYFLFMAAWLNILLFVGFIAAIRLGVGLFAVIAGTISIRKYIQGKTGCEIPQKERRKIIFEKLKLYTQNKNLVLSIIGVVGLAFAVNLIELFCSAGFPAIFTQILALNKLATIQYYLYILLYITFFVLDDILVFIIAMKTLEIKAVSTKYTKYSNLIGGILMLIIGTLLIIKPEVLYFNF